MSGPIEVRTSTRSGCCVVRPEGVLDSSTYRQLRDTLLKLAVEQPDALVVDLHDLGISSQTTLTVFSSVWMQVSEWPGVPIMLVTDDQRVRGMLRGAVSRYTPDYPSVADAVAKAGLPPSRRRAILDMLVPDPDCSSIARSFVQETCERWNLHELATDAVAIANELVDNVEAHARTGCQVRLELRRGMLTIAVRDEDPHPAVLRERIGFAQWGNGLRIVAGLSRHWGCAPHLNGGKVVWAALTASAA